MKNICTCGHTDNDHDNRGCIYCRDCEVFKYSKDFSVRLSKALKMVAKRKAGR